MKKTAIILLSMGAPGSLDTVRPFLFRLFRDPLILRMTAFLRWPLAAFIAWRRTPKAKAIYEQIGGKSPLLENTQKQARALETCLKDKGAYACFVGMRYAAPFIKQAVDDALAFAPERIILLPLYPQYSTTTTLSVVREAKKALKARGWPEEKIKIIQEFYQEEGFIDAVHARIKESLPQERGQECQIIFSAHGLPQSVVEAGDPYVKQCEKTAARLAERLEQKGPPPLSAYQSRVGKGRWVRPYLEDIVETIARQGRPLLIVPIAFVCEHSETMVELQKDMVSKGLLAGAPWVRVTETVGTHPSFITMLSEKVSKEDKKQS